MITSDFAATFAHDWVEAWNDHDLETILSHYAEDVVFHSPRIRTVTKRDVDVVTGKAELRAYWGAALERLRDLFFALDQVLTGSDSVTILYTNERSQQVAETFTFNDEGKVIRSVACYA